MKRSRFSFMGTLALLIVDSLATVGAYVIAYRLRFQTDIVPFVRLPSPLAQWGSAAVVVLCFLTAFAMNGLYSRRRTLNPVDEFVRVIGGVSVGTLFAVAIVSFALLGILELSRLLVVYDWFLSVVLVSIGRALASIVEATLRRNGIGNKRILIIGTGPPAHVVLDKIRRSPELGYTVIGFLDENSLPGFSSELPILGSIGDVASVVKSNSVDEVIVALSRSNSESILDIMDLLDSSDVQVKVLPDVVQMITQDAGIDDLNGLPLVAVRQTRLRGKNVIIKRAMDVVVSMLVLVFMSWFMAIISVLVKLDSRGPVFYIQERVGKDGKVFPCIKFRSMMHRAEAATGPVWAHRDDNRKTRIGAWLRRFSFDEFPQFVNVLLGHMSIVGPRPERPVFVQEFSSRIPRYMDRHAEKSGITGWAQVNGLRGNTSIEERTKYDLWYVENWSPVLDLKIMLKTVAILFTDNQAY
ncbi:MAG TPA: undecaprenyl-phosphate glucose phosphotransferase [Chloroflexota bacterium]|nr:undecaprenyl-phosphate glucose phosphotransferase [Chloroflexota bacterium]